MKKIMIYDIGWDTDGIDVGLPNIVFINNPTEEQINEVNGDYSDVLADYLSDTYGWCVGGFSARLIG